VKLPLQVTFRDMPHSDATDAHVRRRAHKLDTFCDRIMSCRVAVEVPHRHHAHGQRYRCRIDLTVPGQEIVAGNDPSSAEDMHAAIDETFDEAERLLTDYSERRREEARHGASVKNLPLRER
jgi:ribosomal subunit interface protein